MNLCPVLENQIRIQSESITAWKRWMLALVASGGVILALALLGVIPGRTPSLQEIIGAGGLSVSLLGVYPYREMVPRKERLATYRFLLDQFQSFETLSSEDKSALLSMANDALKETIKR